MASGIAATQPTGDIATTQITTAPVGSIQDTDIKQQIAAIGITPLPVNTLQGHGQGIYVNITA